MAQHDLSSIPKGRGRLDGKVALVIGGGSILPGWGNGKAAAVLYAIEGARVLVVDNRAAAAQEHRRRPREVRRPSSATAAGPRARVRRPPSWFVSSYDASCRWCWWSSC